MFWCVFLSVPAWAEREEQTGYLQIKPHILCRPTVQVKGPVVFRHKNVMHNMITISAEMELETHLMPLLGSLLKMHSKMSIVFFFLSIYMLLWSSWGSSSFSWSQHCYSCSSPCCLWEWHPSLCTCSLCCGLFIWHRLNQACNFTPVLKVCGRVCFCLNYPFIVMAH